MPAAAGGRRAVEQAQAAVEQRQAEEGILAGHQHPDGGGRGGDGEPAPPVAAPLQQRRRRGRRRHEDRVGLGDAQQAERQQHQEPGRRIDERPEHDLWRETIGIGLDLEQREGVDVVDQRQLALEEGARCGVEHQEVGEENLHGRPDLGPPGDREDDENHVVQTDGSAEGRGNPKIDPRRRCHGRMVIHCARS
jgi:hypothetical protein